MPKYASERFDRWFAKRAVARVSDPRAAANDRGYKDVILWDDTFVRYNEPHIGIAAVKVLEALAVSRLVSSRPQMLRPPGVQSGQSRHRREVRRAQHQPSLITQNASPARNSNTPIIFLEPSCYSMFAEDYRELKIPGAESIAQRSFLFEKFVERRFWNANRKEHDFRTATSPLPIHAHCHAKSIVDPTFMARLVDKLPGEKRNCSTPAAAEWPAHSG